VAWFIGMGRRARSREKGSKLDLTIKLVTFGFATVGAAFGVYNFVQTQRTRVELDASQRTSSRRSFQISLVNQSSHAVTIVGGEVLFDGVKIGSVTRLAPIPSGGDLQAQLDAQGRATDLPFSMAAGQAFAGQADWVTPEEGYSPQVLESLDHYLEKPRRGGQPTDGRLVLRLDHEPGDNVTAHVRLTVGDSSSSDLDSDSVSPGQSLMDLRPSGQVRDLYFASVIRAPTVVTLTVWGSGPHAILAIRRPMLEWPGTSEQRATFALPRTLATGMYSWEMSTAGRTLAVGGFRTPCVLPRGPGLKPGALLAAGSCSPLAAPAGKSP
jgi:hypothetical protein